MEMWRELVGFQSDNKLNQVYYMIYEMGEKPALVIKKESITVDMTEAEVVAELDKVFNSFTQKLGLRYMDNDTVKQFHMQRAGAEVARRSRRGFPQTRWKNAIYYNGSSPMDSAVMVVQNNGKFGIFKHPKFNDYGFNVIENEQAD